MMPHQPQAILEEAQQLPGLMGRLGAPGFGQPLDQGDRSGDALFRFADAALGFGRGVLGRPYVEHPPSRHTHKGCQGLINLPKMVTTLGADMISISI